MVAAAGAGPEPIEHKALNVDILADAIAFCLSPNAVRAAKSIASKMRAEDGVRTAVNSFYRNLPVATMSCDLIPRQPATWKWKKGKSSLQLSHRAASILVEYKKIDAGSLKLFISRPYP